MFGLFKRNLNNTRKNTIETLAKDLFYQIEVARDEAKSGGLIGEKDFNDRLNSMFVGGYLIGYVDACITELFDDNENKKEVAEGVFEAMFPGSGVDFVRAKLVARQKAAQNNDTGDTQLIEQCHAFDRGMQEAEQEVVQMREKEGYRAVKLKEFLLIGQV